jgi:hypothetical protein
LVIEKEVTELDLEARPQISPLFLIKRESRLVFFKERHKLNIRALLVHSGGIYWLLPVCFALKCKSQGLVVQGDPNDDAFRALH